MTTPVTPPVAPSRRRSLKVYLLGGLAAVLALAALYTWLMLSWVYSEGERAGVLQKFSKRGWICKTYEGELAQYVVGGIAPQIWHFSARDGQAIEQLHAAVGQEVRLHYAEHRGLPTEVTWHDGSPLSAADFVMNIIQVFDQAKPESEIYDEAAIPGTDGFQSHFKGVRIVSTDPLVIETYDDAFQLDAETLISNFVLYPNPTW